MYVIQPKYRALRTRLFKATSDLVQAAHSFKMSWWASGLHGIKPEEKGNI